MYDTLDTEVRNAAKMVRDRMSDANINHMHMEIEISGRVDGGDLKIKYSLGEYGGTVEGGDLLSVIAEFLRRKGWTERNAPLALEPPEAHILTEG